MPHTYYTRTLKPLLDGVAAATLLVATLPITLPAALALAWANGGPVLFRQRRPGLDGRLFTIYKFKTMSDARDAAGNLLPDGDRLHDVGKWIRRTSIDELPQLVNVLQGQLALVGPRPLLTQYLPLYTPEQARRHQVRPGITGWAQVNGRNAINWERKFELDVWYVDHISFKLDMRILWLTAKAVFARKGTSAEGHATMPEFRGTA